MGMFSRLSDIVNSNLNSLLDKAENPEKVIRLIIQEMEETLVEIRSEAAKHIAEKKDLERSVKSATNHAVDWNSKAELAISKGRDDLAKAALVEKHKAQDKASTLQEELDKVNTLISHINEDATRLQIKLNDAKTKQNALLQREKAASTRLKVKAKVNSDDIDKAIQRFESFQRKIDDIEAQVEAFDIGGDGQNLQAQFRNLEQEGRVEKELEALKKKVA